tara:strand:+ start:711 stop:860 length:150 start_codon:yes stop_codon:yes gene_type:complete
MKVTVVPYLVLILIGAAWGSIFIMFIGMFLVLLKNDNIESTDRIKAHEW